MLLRHLGPIWDLPMSILAIQTSAGTHFSGMSRTKPLFSGSIRMYLYIYIYMYIYIYVHMYIFGVPESSSRARNLQKS